MSNMNVPTEKMQKMASFIASAAPQLEKLAAQQTALEQSSPAWVDGLIAQGLLRKEARDNAIRDLNEGGIEKISEVIEFLISSVSPAPIGAPAEKRASHSAPAKGTRASDDAWVRAMVG